MGRSKPFSIDTSQEAHEVYLECLRRMTVADKAALLEALNDEVRELAEAGIRRRYPEADDHEVLMRYGLLTIGPDLMKAAYGWEEPVGG